MSRMLKPGSFEHNSRILKDVTRDFASTEMIWQKNLRRTSMIGRSHRRHEQDFKSLATLKTYWPLEDQTPVIPMLDATFVSYHLFVVFPTATIKSFFSKLLFALCVSLSISLISPQTLGPNRGWMEMSLYFLDRWVNWRLTDGFRTWRITWRITL